MVTMRTRSYNNYMTKWLGKDKSYAPASGWTIKDVTCLVGGKSEIKDSIHPDWMRKNRKKPKVATPFDIGGEMYLNRYEFNVSPTIVNITANGAAGTKYEYDGAYVAAHISSGNYPLTSTQADSIANYFINGIGGHLQESSLPSLTAMGTLGWNRYKPTSPHGQLGAGLAELLSDGLPNLGDLLKLYHMAATHKNVRKRLDGASGGFLGHQFGLMPLLKDIQDFVKNMLNADKAIKQLARDNGRPVRRSGPIRVVDPEPTLTKENVGNSTWLNPGGLYFGIYGTKQGNRSYSFTDRAEYRFSGEFTYLLDPKRFGFKGFTDRQTWQLERIVFGLDPLDPSMWYAAIPWSWLIDWFIPFGAILQNLNDSADKLVARYAYVTLKRVSTHQSTRIFYLNDEIQRTALCSLNIEYQHRIAASPYGFGLTFSGFSLKQLAILAALGWQKLS